MKYERMLIEKESPEEYGYDRIRYNLSESSLRDRTVADLLGQAGGLPDLTLLYGAHRGEKRLRDLITAQGDGFGPEDVLVTAGAAGALFIIATSLLDERDHLVVVRPNYATNIETPRSIGCSISYIDLAFEHGFALDIDAIAAAIQPNTRYVSITSPHNPTGVMIGADDLHRLIALVESHNCRLLVDETYRDISYDRQLPIAAGLSPHVISVCSLSKAFGLPGIRVGWLICRDQALYETFLAAKEQIGICGSVIDEWLAVQALEQRDAFLAEIRPMMARRREIVRDWVACEELVEWVEPTGGAVCFPRLKVGSDYDFQAFYVRLLEREGTYVGPGHWFEMPRAHFRIGFGWPTETELKHGLAGISAAIRQ